jgi:hypothetical protein
VTRHAARCADAQRRRATAGMFRSSVETKERMKMASLRMDYDTRMIGKRALIGVTRVTPKGTIIRQMFGTIAAIDPQSVEIELEGADAGKTIRLPSTQGAFKMAGPGDYLLWETGEILADPDFVGAWTLHEAAA